MSGWENKATSRHIHIKSSYHEGLHAFFDSGIRVLEGFVIDAHEIAERNSAVAWGLVFTKELAGRSNKAIFGAVYGYHYRRPCLHRVGYHAVLNALYDPIGHNLN